MIDNLAFLTLICKTMKKTLIMRDTIIFDAHQTFWLKKTKSQYVWTIRQNKPKHRRHVFMATKYRSMKNYWRMTCLTLTLTFKWMNWKTHDPHVLSTYLSAFYPFLGLFTLFRQPGRDPRSAEFSSFHYKFCVILLSFYGLLAIL